MNNPESSDRGNWGSKVAFIFAASGSAIGLGSIWRFPLFVGLNGGAAFVFSYLLAVFFIGFTVMLAELTIGRHTRKNPVGAFKFIKPHTIFGAFRGQVSWNNSAAIFEKFAANPVEVLICLFIIIALTSYVISKGVKGGIERWSKILMPVLFVLIIILAVRALTLPGAGPGLSFYLKPDFSDFNLKVILFAIGQAFFSLSLGMGTMMTYGSYISKKENLVSSAGWVCLSTALVAILAGIIIFPTLFNTLQLTPDKFKQEFEVSTGLMFQVFPIIISKMPGGYFFGILFFALLLIAALTSTISMLEVPTAYLVDERKWSRTKAAVIIGIVSFLLGIPSALSSGGVKFLTKFNYMIKMDLVFGNIMLAVGGLLISLFLVHAWKVKNALKEISHGNSRFRLKGLWVFDIRFLVPIAVIIILIFIKTLAG